MNRRTGGVGQQARVRRPVRTFVRVDDSSTTIGCTGNLDAAGTASFLAELRQLAGVCSGGLIVDLSACTEITTTLLADLLAVQAICVGRGCALTARVGHPNIASALKLAGIPMTGGPSRATAATFTG
jgi:hypothetical protein